MKLDKFLGFLSGLCPAQGRRGSSSPSGAFRVRWTDDWHEIANLKPLWEALLSRSANDVPFLSTLWLGPWWEVFGPVEGRKPSLFTLYESGRLIALAPLVRRTHWYRHGLPFRRLELWGSGEREEHAIGSDYLNLIVEAGREAEAVSVFVRELVRQEWEEFVIPLMDGEGPMPWLMAREFESWGMEVTVEECEKSLFVETSGSWETYLGRLTGSGRYVVRRSLREFEAWAGEAARLHEARTESERRTGMEILKRLHARRWEGSTGETRGGAGGVFGSVFFARFHERTGPDLLKAEVLKLMWLTVRDEPIAAVYNLDWRGRVYFYQCGRRLDVPKAIRPGTVLLVMAIRRAMEAGRREFDLLAGDVRYKRELATGTRPLVRLRVARPGWRERVRQGLEATKSLLRRYRLNAQQPPVPETSPPD